MSELDDMFDEYMKYLEIPKIKEEPINKWITTLQQLRGRRIVNNKCVDCNVEFLYGNQGKKTCPECGITDYDMTDATILKKTPPYKRMTHFKDWIIKTQAKHNAKIDIATLELIKKEIKDKSYIGIKKTLKKLRLTKHYEDAWYILSYIDPKADLFKISIDEENTLCQLFLNVQIAWEQIKPKVRKSIISYPFVITKLLDIIKRPELKKYFNLPRYNKVLEYEAQWRRLIYIPPFSHAFE
jgi:uncharacterized Zn finger protein (UPF0148 family)